MHRIPHRRACRTAALAAVLLLGVGLAPAIASAAGTRGTATGAESVSVGTWGVTAATTSMVFTSNTFRTSSVTNTGTIALTAESYAVTVSKPASGTPTVKIFQCAVAWVSTRCSGGTGTQVGGTLASNSTTTVTSSTALAPGATDFLQIRPASVTSSTTVTLSPKVTSPTQLRAAVKTTQ
jgi:hypothetical protein